MRIFQTLVSNLLKEGKIEDLQAKYPALNVQEIAENDPTPQKKYLSWMCKQLSFGASENDLYPTVKSFDKNIARIQSKDINSYKTARELEDVIKALPEKSKTQQRQEVKGNAPKIYEDDNVVVVRPDDKNSCVVYGANTKWCITMKNASYYEQYTSNNVVFYFVISKTLEQSDPNAKIALAMIRDDENNVKKIEIYDALDKQIAQKISPQILNLCKIDAEKQPMGLLAKIKSKKASVEELTQAAKSDDIEVRRLVALSRNIPEKIFLILSRDENDDVRSCVALNPKTPIKILVALSKDENDDVRSCVAENKNTPAEVLIVLSRDEIDYVRYSVAQNSNTHSEVLDVLSRDENENVRSCVALNPNTSKEVLDALSRDENNYIRLCAQERLKQANENLVREFVRIMCS